MKPLQTLKYAVAATAVVFIVACTETPSEIPASSTERETIENPDYEIIRSLGYQTEGIVEEEDMYVVEGDIL
jgi:hypothetical protein